MSTKTKSTKSSKSSTTAKAARKPSKQKTKTKPKTKKKTCGCEIPKPVLPPPDNSYQYDYIDQLEKLDAPTYFYYVVNNENKEKYVVSGIELPYNDAKTIAQAATGGDDVYVIKIAGPIAWIFINVFKVVEIELGS